MLVVLSMMFVPIVLTLAFLYVWYSGYKQIKPRVREIKPNLKIKLYPSTSARGYLWGRVLIKGEVYKAVIKVSDLGDNILFSKSKWDYYKREASKEFKSITMFEAMNNEKLTEDELHLLHDLGQEYQISRPQSMDELFVSRTFFNITGEIVDSVFEIHGKYYVFNRINNPNNFHKFNQSVILNIVKILRSKQ